ncbi:tonB-system energizer ExbB [Paracoccus sp. DMF]|uniref:tonB-system energizer ExbB n=1 Tax=Paracoccus sp. DMF TaxID=400837 RepID=UPI0021E3F4B0|nr:tonB-system energizer ExbB [Paracoccus sp. DMF]MCV2447697.1 tonB-system energizer ExbB [Paracoccus sp. DMF]
MTNLTLPRHRAGTALAFACLMLATPIAAQDSTATQPAPAAPEVQTQPAPATAPSTTAPEAGTPAAETPAAPAPAATTPAAEPTTPAPAPATTEPAATTATPAPAASTPAPSAPETPAAAPAETPAAQAAAPQAQPEPAGSSILPQALQDALEPMLNPAPRDPTLPHDLSPWGMFLAADWVVKGVMIGLAFASVITWTVLIAKMLELAGAMKRAQSGIRRIETATSLPSALNAAGRRRDPVSRMIRAAATEYDRSAPALDQAGDSGVKERVESHLDRIEAVAGRRMSRGTGVLATIGSTAPFVGLFGTVWGIMNSFIGISQAQTTNLAVVAPGIAEALLATAIGLVAAIPAVVIYNVFARAITGYRLRLANASAGVRRLVSRDLDFRGAVARSEV